MQKNLPIGKNTQKSKLSTDLDYLRKAVNQAKKSVEEGGFPAGAIIVKDRKIIAEGISIGFQLNDPTSHAETSSIRQACAKLKTTDLSGATLYASLQPCLMCFSVSNWSNITRIVYGCIKTKEMVEKVYYEGFNDIGEVNQNNRKKIELIYLPDFEEELLGLIKSWETKNLL